MKIELTANGETFTLDTEEDGASIQETLEAYAEAKAKPIRERNEELTELVISDILRMRSQTEEDFDEEDEREFLETMSDHPDRLKKHWNRARKRFKPDETETDEGEELEEGDEADEFVPDYSGEDD